MTCMQRPCTQHAPRTKTSGARLSQSGQAQACSMRGNSRLARRPGPGGSAKKGLSRGLPRDGVFWPKKGGRKMCSSQCRASYLRTIFGPREAGALPGHREERRETTARQAWTPGRLKRAPVNAGGVRAAVRVAFWKTFKTTVLLIKNTSFPGSLRHASGNRIYSPICPQTVREVFLCFA